MNHAGELSFISVLLRLVLALLVGAVLGYGRAKKKANAGFRTYMLTSVGAALAMIISLYEYRMLYFGGWAYMTAIAELKFDGARYASQVITGIGFLAAGTILSTQHQQVSGLTTAIGLFTSACLGIAAGCGFYAVVVVGLLIIIFAMEFLQPIEIEFKRRLRHMTIYVEFDDLENLDRITSIIRDHSATIYELDIERTKMEDEQYPGAVIALRLDRSRTSHSSLLSTVAELDCVNAVQELVS